MYEGNDKMTDRNEEEEIATDGPGLMETRGEEKWRQIKGKMLIFVSSG